MSRIIIKNLPLNVDEKKLQEHFSKCPRSNLMITDCKLMKSKDGRSRRFAFIGYDNEDQATEAVKHFNMTFIGATKIEVALAKTMKEASLARVHGKRRVDEMKTVDSSNKKSRKNGNSSSRNNEDEIEDERFQEFMNVMRPRKDQKTWANDIIIGNEASDTRISKQAENLSDDEYENVPSRETVEADEPMVSLSDFQGPKQKTETEEIETVQNEDISENEEDGLAKNEGVSDLEWMRMRSQRMKENEEEHEQQENDIKRGENKDLNNEEAETILPQSDHDKAIDKIKETGRLFLRNIPYSTGESEFRQLFEKYGALEEVHLPIDPKSGKSKGFLYVQFADTMDAASAFENEDGNIFHGRILHILPGDPKKGDKRLDEFDLKNLPLKKQKELKKKAMAFKQQFAWNSLYLNSDAVMNSVASRLGIKKSDLISADSSDSAVKQAIAETSVINNIKQYFESKGVNLASFNKKERSDLVILVKNFPFDTSIEEITDLFAEYGELKRVLMPPDGGIAMVVFKTVPQAKAAFTKLAYKRFKTSILYLEKGPAGLFEEDDQTSEVKEPVKNAKVSVSEILDTERELKDDTPTFNGSTVSIFVKNLSFSTTNDSLTKAFKPLDGFASTKIQTKADAKNPGKSLSMGFGFIEFKSKEEADIALETMQGYVLDGHRLELKLSHRGQESSIAKAGKQPKNKIIVKNIPFEATKKDMQKLLGAFGQLRSLRVPQKFDRTTRGFAFAEFVTAKEAENAMKSLQGTHLLGRRLVMEFAQQDAASAEEEIARMEAKVQKQVTQQTIQGLRLGGKRQVDVENGENDEFES